MRGLTLGAWVALSSASCEAPCGAPVEPVLARPGPGGGGNVLVVMLDDVGVDQLDAWGLNPVPARTPTIDCLCERGLRFTQTWASPSCSPSRAELLTGRYSRRLGIGTIFTPDEAGYELPLAEDTLAEVARRGGYATGLFGKWHLSEPTQPAASTHANASGFDRFAGSLANLNTTTSGHRSNNYSSWERIVDGAVGTSTVYPSTATVDDALAFIDEVEERPWLVVLSFHAPHVPLHWPPASLMGHRQDSFSPAHQQYLAMLEAADRELGRFLRTLDADTRADTTVVLFGDNGTASEHISPELDPTRGKTTLYELGIRVPVVVSGPAVAKPGVTDAITHVVDILPTVAEIIGVAPRPDLDGRSWGPLLDGSRQEVHETVASSRFEPLGPGPPTALTRTIRTRSHKLMVGWDGREQLLRVAPDELVEGADLLAEPLSAADAAALETLRASLGALDASVAAGWEAE